MVTAVLIENPLRADKRTVEVLEAGGTLGDALPDHWTAWVARVNGVEREGDYVLDPEDYVVAIQRPGDPVTIITNILISLAISAVFALLFPAPKPPNARDDESSPTYTFGGITNNRAEGQPIPVIYGRMKSGGTIVNEFIETRGIPPKDTLRQMISVGEGEVESVGGVSSDTPAALPLTDATIPNEVFINGNPAQNFSGVKAWVRLGTNQQEVIPGFNETRSVFAVGSNLISDESDISASQTAVLVSGFSISGDDEFTSVNDAIWDANEVSFDFADEEVDGFVITLNMPQGFYGTNTSTGATTSAFLGYQVRYIELDGSGVPIASGGYNSDGYVRLPVEGPFPLRERRPFQVQFSGRFQDPQNYSPSTPGKALFTDAGRTGANASYAVGTGGYSSGFEIPHLAGFAWIKLSAAGEYRICSSETPSPQRGFRFGIRLISGKHVLALRIGRGSRFLEYVAGRITQGSTIAVPATSLADGLLDENAIDQWVHVGFAYRQNESITLFVNGRSVPTVKDEGVGSPGEIDLEWTRQPILVGGHLTNGNQQGDFLVDELKLYDAPMGAGDANADFGSGSGTVGPALGLDNEMFFRGVYDDASGNNFATSPETWFATTPTLNGTGTTSGTAVGYVRSGAGGNLKRSRYRLEILRTTRTSTKSTVGNDVEVSDMQSVISDSFTYPNAALIGLEIDASEQLNSGIPTTTAIVKGRRCPIWDGASTAAPAVRYEWTANPAWIALELITNRRYGLGRFYDLASVDLVNWKAWADYCDEVVFDGRPRITIDNTGGTGNVSDFYFSNALTDPDTGDTRGEIWFEIDILDQGSLQSTWQVGRYLRFSGLPDATNPAVDNDPNSPDGEGYEIFSVELIDGVWTLKCYWDRTDETDPWTSGNRLGADELAGGVTDLDGAKVEGGQYRFEFNGVFDKIQPAWDALLDIMATGRAAPVPLGSELSLRWSRPRSAIGVLTPSNIIEDSFTCDFSSERTRPNSLTLNILDAEQGFEPVPVQVQSDDLDSITNQSFVRQENQQLFGVTDSGQAERHGNYILNINENQRRSGTFRAALDALPYQVGDLLRISSDVLPRGDAGRTLASSSPTKAAALLSREAFSSGDWTASNVTVTANTATDPLGGGAVADSAVPTVANGYISQDLDFPSNGEGWVSVSLLVDASLGATKMRLGLVTDRAEIIVRFDLAAHTVAVAQSVDLPARGRIQSMGGAWHYVQGSWYVKASDGELTTNTLRLKIYPDSPTGTNGCRLSKITATQSEYGALFVPDRGVVIDREVTISGAASVYVQDLRGQLVSGSVSTSLTPNGTYYPGDVIWIQSNLVSIPTRGCPYIVAATADQLVVEISGISRSPDLSAEFSWVEYVDSAYQDDATEDGNRDQTILDYPGQFLVNPGVTAGVSGGGVDTMTQTSPGVFVTSVEMTWENPVEAEQSMIGSRIFVREHVAGQDDNGGWRQVADVQGVQTRATVTLEGARAGEFYEFSVVPRLPGLSLLLPRQGARFVQRIRGLAWRPLDPTAITGTQEGRELVYAATFEENSGESLQRVPRTEFRRGGWILGQPVALTAEGSPSVTSSDTFEELSGETVGTIYGRSLNRANVYGAALEVDTGYAALKGTGTPNLQFDAEEKWETATSGGWVTAIPGVNGPFVTDLTENAAGYLEFDGSALTGNFRTSFDATQVVGVGQSQQPRPLLVMAAVRAEQVHPVTLDELPYALGSLEMQRWSFEGPTEVADDDLANCTLELQIRVNVDGTSSGWSEYEPFRCGVFNCVDFQLRLYATRPSTDYQIKIHQLHTNVAVPLKAASDTDTQLGFHRDEIL